jgi:hypothetical protein
MVPAGLKSAWTAPRNLFHEANQRYGGFEPDIRGEIEAVATG